jgi:hypothetical protein
MDTRSLQKMVITLAVAASTGVGIWVLMYPSASDPKNIRYVFWKAGIYEMDPDTAAETLVGDAGRDRLVVGKTKVQLRSKFGYLVTPTSASPYLKGCYQRSPWKNRDVLFIRKSSWMVVFDGERATNLVLIKGC